MAQAVEHMPSKCEALNSNPLNTKVFFKANAYLPLQDGALGLWEMNNGEVR
jgi:hypothetical protein